MLQDRLQTALAKFGFAMMRVRLQTEHSESGGVQTLSCSPAYADHNAGYSTFQAGLLHRQPGYVEVVEFFDRALRLRSNAGGWLIGMGMSLEVLDRKAEAQEAIRKAKASGNLPADLQNNANQRLR